MPSDPNDLTKILVVPLATMIGQVAQGVAKAQLALDRAALQTAQDLATNYPDLQALGYVPTFYAIPEASVEIKMAMHVEESGSGQARKTKAFLMPWNAKVQNAYKTTSDGASTLRFRVVPVPPPTLKGG